MRGAEQVVALKRHLEDVVRVEVERLVEVDQRVARRPDLRIREVAAAVGITERAAQGILSELVDAGFAIEASIEMIPVLTLQTASEYRYGGKLSKRRAMRTLDFVDL